MFSHVVVGTNNLENAKRFYDAVLGALGIGEGRLDDNGSRRRYAYRTSTGAFFVTEPINGQVASPANGGTIGFTCRSSAEVDDWHAAGVANGGQSAENAPGWRGPAGSGLYLAYLRDADGNKLCAAYRPAA
ncbi:VOC family protein [Pandoraea anhela]|uniref:Lactoylglutathione lyase protein n=1 Tax=Pandoraea anhela TaxID=2508295 RepID=A0A5E4V402_9BURK|nr:VOC family protein [Pandoraea anhela]VVE06987.1 Putative lactoylglutathione lyase protein [Pandoraea anhela]